MKKLSFLMGCLAIMIAGAMIISCEGPQGQAGTNGADGADGADGAPGQDANSTCIECHSDDQVIVAKTRQHANSGHSMGHTAGYTNRSGCAQCHTSQGFVDNLIGMDGAPYEDVTQPNCYTCHSIHSTYTEADWALTSIATPEPESGSTGVDIGNGNQCSSCHQMRGQYLLVDSLWTDYELGTATVTVTSDLKRAGVHHGPQYNLLVGMDLFDEFAGPAPGALKDHILGQVDDGCVTCHMADGFGDLTGHSMAMTWEYHGEENFNWPAACDECHAAASRYVPHPLTLKFEAISAEVEGLLGQLYTLLVDSGLMFEEGTDDEFLMKPGVFSTSLLAAHVNYNAVREDKSMGFHNPEYVITVLENTIAALTP